MTARKLPPLLVGEVYKSPPLHSMDFTAPDIEREMQGEATSLLRLKFVNETGVDVPVRAFQLQMLMGSLMRAFPQQALAQLRFCDDDGKADGKSDGKDDPGSVRRKSR